MSEFENAGDVAAKELNRWAWYFDALKGKFGPIHDGEPQQGYYRVRSKGGQWEPVAIWFEDGAWLAYRAGREVRADEIWSYCCRQPIEHAAYEKAMAGGGFDDEPPAPAIGDNSGATDPFEALRIEFIGEKEQAEEILAKGIHTQADADRASIWKDRFLKIRSRAQAMFKAEKQPINDAGKAVDDKWRFLAHEKDSDTTAMAEKLRLGMDGFLKAQRRAEDERQRKARDEADRIRREAEDAARKAREAEGASDREREAAAREAERQAELARAAEREAEARKVNAGRTGARTSIRVEKVGVVTDYSKAAAALVAIKHKDLIAVIDQLAQRAAKAGMPFDGMEIREEEKVV